MPRIARVVVPGAAHHVTQRGVRKMQVFFSDEDRALYVRLLREHSRLHELRIAAWCLMPNHVHLVAVPTRPDSLAAALGAAHWRYTSTVNRREGWRGYLFQGWFYSCPLDGAHTIAAIRYTLRNPVRAGLVDQPWQYAWSSARWTVGDARVDPLAEWIAAMEEVDDWREFLSAESSDCEDVRRHTRTGRPLGSSELMRKAEEAAGRSLHPLPPGRKRRIGHAGDTHLASEHPASE